MSREAVYTGKRREVGLWQRTNSDGTVVFELQKRVHGKPTRIVLDARTKTDAIREARQRSAQADVAPKAGDRSVTVAALAAAHAEWLDSGASGKAGGTVTLWKAQIASHVVTHLGAGRKAADVQTAEIVRMIDALRTRKRGNGRPLSGSTIRSVVTACKSMFDYGRTRLGCVTVNPCDGLKSGKGGDRPSGARQTDPRYLSQAEVGELLAKLSDESRPVAATCFWAGLRVSEALALTWKDVSFTDETLRVNGTKTKAAAATVPLAPALARELHAHRARTPLHHLGADHLVFSTRSGRPVHRRNVLRAVHGAGDAAWLNPEGEEKIGVHDLRHSFAAMLIQRGLPINVVAKLMRHEHPEITLRVYGGLIETDALSLGEALTAAGVGR